MPVTRWTGASVPAPDDDLLKAWDAYDDSAGRLLPAASVAAARVMLASAARIRCGRRDYSHLNQVPGL